MQFFAYNFVLRKFFRQILLRFIKACGFEIMDTKRRVVCGRVV